MKRIRTYARVSRAISAGATVRQPLAMVVIGGPITSTLLTLLILPTLYKWFERGRVERSLQDTDDEPPRRGLAR